jgi:hypothetical protein
MVINLLHPAPLSRMRSAVQCRNLTSGQTSSSSPVLVLKVTNWNGRRNRCQVHLNELLLSCQVTHPIFVIARSTKKGNSIPRDYIRPRGHKVCLFHKRSSDVSSCLVQYSLIGCFSVPDFPTISYIDVCPKWSEKTTISIEGEGVGSVLRYFC